MSAAETAPAHAVGKGGIGAHLAALLIALLLLFWTLLPIYNMILVALEPGDSVFSGALWPETFSLENFRIVFTQDHWYLKHFWLQMLNSLIVGLAAAFFTVLIGSMASFSIQRLRLRYGTLLSNTALLSYAIPLSFLAIPFYNILHNYGLLDNLWALIIVAVTFATPYAIFIFSQYSASIPIELDEAARIDGASVPQIYFKLYMPLMRPALVAVGTYALLLAWNEYLYAFLLLSSETTVTVPVALGYFLSSDDSPWNILMAAALIYSIPPLVIYYAMRRHMTTGLTVGSVKG
ncbi:carbohydrate ABC transporter membrane protein 2, CUT1 family [Arboricoccus pini]|uniref:Carbohydrate ABC transporter membrane protein 2, CUT1 family n=1 Tax=Arboricoccus pini TaxID=1963835 RepID=A0A212R6I8_9PROT|nr:carbohydrate ABC transporter permease [Arboricoccus pini]SNB67759.1 carbohydrate ABC transporter membrane protein 2, CUT1 family [Arboricoccus pini]